MILLEYSICYVPAKHCSIIEQCLANNFLHVLYIICKWKQFEDSFLILLSLYYQTTRIFFLKSSVPFAAPIYLQLMIR